jgi:hypothetical protein
MKAIGRTSQRIIWTTGGTVGPGGRALTAYRVTGWSPSAQIERADHIGLGLAN